MESYEADLIKYESAQDNEQLAYEREVEFFKEDTDELFDKIQMTVELIQSIEKNYEFDLTDIIKSELKEICEDLIKG